MASTEADAFGKAHVPGWADGSGGYSLDTLGCFLVVESALPGLLDAVGAALTAAGSGPLVACDFGAADGGTSLPLWHAVVDCVKAADSAREVHLLYEDQATNDWKSVFAYSDGRLRLPTVPGLQLSTAAATPLALRQGVFVAAVGTSFHRQCMPSRSLHLGFSATALHWLSRKPCDLPALHHTRSPPGCAAAAAFALQAAEDWEKLLCARAAELAPGGRLVLMNLARDELAQCLGSTAASGGPAQAMYAELQGAWSSLVADGHVSAAEAGRATFINYYRSTEEVAAPLQAGGAAHAAGLRLLSLRTHLTRCPFRAAWLASGADAEAHAAAFVRTVRTWSESSFSTALDGARPAEERARTVEELYRRYAASVARAPADHGMDYVHCYMELEKV